MADKFKQLEEKHIEFISNQHMFFVGTAGAKGKVNVSPKGMDTLRVVNPNTVIWSNHTGSGNETSVHVQENERMTIMFCSFDKAPLILRLYGLAQVIHPRDDAWDSMESHFGKLLGVRQYFQLTIDMVMTSCGFGVPYYEYQGEIETLLNWEKKLP